MNLKLIMALVADDKTEEVLSAARKAGATGATVIMIFLFIDILQLDLTPIAL